MENVSTTKRPSKITVGNGEKKLVAGAIGRTATMTTTLDEYRAGHPIIN